MSWDFDFDDEENFDGFDTADSIFFSGDADNDGNYDMPFFQQQDITPQYQPAAVSPQPIQTVKPMSAVPLQQTAYQSQGNLAEENDLLRQFFKSLKEKAARAESLNQSLKSQLEDCRNWFKDAMFTGISHHK